jgi:hypothetical protein
MFWHFLVHDQGIDHIMFFHAKSLEHSMITFRGRILTFTPGSRAPKPISPVFGGVVWKQNAAFKMNKS